MNGPKQKDTLRGKLDCEGDTQKCEEAVPKNEDNQKKVNVGLRGSAAGRGHDYEEKYVARKLISPSEDHRKEDKKEYKVSEPSTLHLAGPSVVCCGSSAQHNRTIFATRWC